MLLLCFAVLQLSAHDKNKTNPEECKSYVLIQGSSNINKFEFVNKNPNFTKRNHDNGENKLSQSIRIPIRDFSGPNKLMLNDFYKMLNADQYPDIKINIEAYNSEDFDEESGSTLLDTKITIAGKTHDYLIPCDVIYCETSGTVLKGSLEVLLSTFDIDPPQKILGAVKVDNEVFITFSFSYL
ncbi:YceI family protein [Maribellus sp. YY47]|uniref:YceI family protein n=1 Tax=Maribellus sp. YY47 TaxID=2929486 RepID=UPI002001D077|nr:YceI family protein [Maribellus sp. YY47]MCK3683793.1 YceI family protein [Maribellus sp. YY47]